MVHGAHPGIAKPLKGLGSGVLELALKFKGDAFRLVYALKLHDDLWVIHAFRKKLKTGVRARPEITESDIVA